MTENKKRKMIAPIVITVIMCLLVIGQVIGLFFVPDVPFWAAMAGIAVCLIFLGLIIYVLVERIKDIKSGEEDDLDNY